MTCKLCGDTGKMGSDGYWVHCSCKKGTDRRIMGDVEFERLNDSWLSGEEK